VTGQVNSLSSQGFRFANQPGHRPADLARYIRYHPLAPSGRRGRRLY
jgi:hypothetical protein